LIRRDPRDLSRIYVYLEKEKSYLEIQYRSLSHPAISLFEHRLALKKLKVIAKEQVNENSLFRAIDEMRHIVKTSVSQTRTMRKNRTRIQENAKIQPKAISTIKFDKKNIDEDNTEAFDNIEVW